MAAKALIDAGTPTALDDATATRLGLKVYQHGGSYKDGLSPQITAGNSQTGWVVNNSVFIPYQMQDGTWRLKFNFKVSFNSTQYCAAFVNVILAFNQAISVSTADNTTLSSELYQHADFSSGSVSVFGNRFGAVAIAAAMSGDVALASKPTWAY